MRIIAIVCTCILALGINGLKAQSIKIYDAVTGEELDSTHLPNRVRFSVANLNPPSADPNSNKQPSWGYLWTFGDCSMPSFEAEPIYEYEALPGNYQVSVALTPKYADEDEELPLLKKNVGISGPFTSIDDEAPTYSFEVGKSIEIDPVRDCKIGDHNTFLIHYKNSQNQTYQSAEIQFEYDAYYMEFNANYLDGCGYDSYSHQLLNNGSKGLLTLSYSNLNVNEERFLSVSLLTKSTAVLGIPLQFKARLYSDQGNTLVSDDLLVMDVTNSHDPNNKLVTTNGQCVLDSLIYTINFENEGTAPADLVYLIDEVDRQLDMNSISMISSSHSPHIVPIIDSISLGNTFNPGTMSLDSTQSLFLFRDTLLRRLAIVHPHIELAPSGQNLNGVSQEIGASIGTGYFRYSILLDGSVPPAASNQIGTHANIYFDDNHPIPTNTPLSNRITCYCEPNNNNSQVDWIHRVKTDSINNKSGNNGGYASFRNLEARFIPGSFQAITLSPGMAGTMAKAYNWFVYLDMNRNGIFENMETIYTTSGFGTLTGLMHIPTALSSGKTAMRIVMSDSSYTSSCTQSIDGEIEDYSVNIIHPGKPDIEIVNQALNKRTVPNGSSLILTSTFRNHGPDSVRSPFPYSIYFSKDPHFDSTDMFLMQGMAPLMASGTEFGKPDTIQIPYGTEGSWYLVTVADNSHAIDENDETNNHAFVHLVVGPRLADLRIKRNRTCATKLRPGADFTLETKVVNIGLSIAKNTTTPAYLHVLLSQNRKVDAQDLVLDSIQLDSILVDSNYSFLFNLSIPSQQSPDRYFILTSVDHYNVIPEQRENNNTAASRINVAQKPKARTPYFSSFECSELAGFWAVDDSLKLRVNTSDLVTPYHGHKTLTLEAPNAGKHAWTDLSVDMSGLGSGAPCLSFAWKDLDTLSGDTLNGIYISDNDSLFHKVFDLNATNSQWALNQLNLDSTASAHGFNRYGDLTIRFMYKEARQSSSAGLAIDFVSLYSMNGPNNQPPTAIAPHAASPFANESIRLFPNPNTGSFSLTIHSERKNVPAQVKVYNSLGTCLYNETHFLKNPGNQLISVSGAWPKGNYFCTVWTETRVKTFPFVVIE